MLWLLIWTSKNWFHSQHLKLGHKYFVLILKKVKNYIARNITSTSRPAYIFWRTLGILYFLFFMSVCGAQTHDLWFVFNKSSLRYNHSLYIFWNNIIMWTFFHLFPLLISNRCLWSDTYDAVAAYDMILICLTVLKWTSPSDQVPSCLIHWMMLW